MPLNEYYCEKCGIKEELIQKMALTDEDGKAQLEEAKQKLCPDYAHLKKYGREKEVNCELKKAVGSMSFKVKRYPNKLI